MRVLYISASEFSGTTFLSFLLNAHSKMATIGHSMGWPFREGEEFFCSCGSNLEECPLFNYVAMRFAEHRLKFNPRDFGTRFSLASNKRLDNWLVGSLPVIRNTKLEAIRNRIVYGVPPLRKKLQEQLRANRVLFDAVCEKLGASVYVDNSHSPFRITHLLKEQSFEISNLHLVRDPRAVAFSMRKNKNMPLDSGVGSWIRRQRDAMRIAPRVCNNLIVRYEDLVSDVNQTLGKIHEFVGVNHEPFSGDFKKSEHHVLGNEMRLRDGGVRVDTRWLTELSEIEINSITAMLRNAQNRYGDEPISHLIESYIGKQD